MCSSCAHAPRCTGTICFDNPRSSSYDSIRGQRLPHPSQQSTHVFVRYSSVAAPLQQSAHVFVSSRASLEADECAVRRIAVGPKPTRTLGLVYVTDKYGIGLTCAGGHASVSRIAANVGVPAFSYEIPLLLLICTGLLVALLVLVLRLTALLWTLLGAGPAVVKGQADRAGPHIALKEVDTC